MYLIGSLLDENHFAEHSDIDLAVSGLETDKYFKALNSIWKILPKGVKGFDLIPMKSLLKIYQRN
ncbi:MAG: hypothetical protein HY752_06230 [Nitrospirae bacterium]|nr:hypothetical protein [Nitrospirota bacterium]